MLHEHSPVENPGPNHLDADPGSEHRCADPVADPESYSGPDHRRANTESYPGPNHLRADAVADPGPDHRRADPGPDHHRTDTESYPSFNDRLRWAQPESSSSPGFIRPTSYTVADSSG